MAVSTRSVAGAQSVSRPRRRGRGRSAKDRLTVAAGRAAVVVVLVAAWAYLPRIDVLADNFAVFDPFFVSSPDRVFDRVADLAGRGAEAAVWSALATTIQATIIGAGLGFGFGCLCGVMLSNSERWSKILTPFLIALNATPRIALIPIFILIAGATMTMTVLTALLVTFFMVFWNAYSGGKSVPPHVIQNAQLLGAMPGEITRRVRVPYALVWALAALPNTVAFSLTTVVTAELLTGQLGMGQLLASSIGTVDSTLTFAVVFYLTVVGVLLVTIASFATRRLLHWWGDSTATGL